jgi:four helix bundle protein
MEFAVRVFAFCREFATTWDTRCVGQQLIESATSAAMNYRACGRSRSTREFISKLGVVVEEADETVGWLEFIARSNLARGEALDSLLKEARELVAIFAASHRTAKAHHANTSRDRITRPQMAR